MKLILCLTLLMSFGAFAKTKIDFSQALNEDVEKDIRKDDEKFKKDETRGPASVDPEAAQVEDTPKIDKNVRQI